jgi:hypothetical protein
MLTKNRFLAFEKETQPKPMAVLPSLTDIFCLYYPSDRAKRISRGSNSAIRRKVGKIS